MSKMAKSKRAKGKKYEFSEEWRTNVIGRLVKIVKIKDMAIKIEESVYKDTCDVSEDGTIGDISFKTKYQHRIQRIITNLDKKYFGNENLLKRLLNKEISPEDLVYMTPEEMYPEKWDAIKRKQEEENKFLTENQRKATSNRIRCRKCGKNEVATMEIQSRSMDEPATIIYECVVCGNKW